MAPGAVLEGSFIWAKARSGEAIIRPSRQGKSARIWKFLRRDRIGVVVTSKPQCFRQKKAVKSCIRTPWCALNPACPSHKRSWLSLDVIHSACLDPARGGEGAVRGRVPIKPTEK